MYDRVTSAIGKFGSSCLLFRFACIMMNFSLLIFLAIYGVHGLGDPTSRANPGEYNYFVMVWYRNKFHCGGTIIDQRHIITRGACVMDIPTSNLLIVAGTINTRVSKTRPLHVESVHIHYGFRAIDDGVMSDEIRWEHDIAVLKLVNRIVWDSLTAPAALMIGGYYWNSALKCEVPGWRRTYADTSREYYYVRWVEANTYIEEDCVRSGVRLLKNEKCVSWQAISNRRITTIQYYNGSPIVYGNGVIGIADGRNMKKFHTFLNLLPYKDFIENAIDDKKYDVKPGEMKYVVSVWYQGIFKCGGIILDASHILTTGDCVQYANHTNLRVIVGHTRVLEIDPQIQWLSVNKIEMHPDYEEFIHFDGPKFMHIKNNYAILTLAVLLKWGPTIGPAPLLNTHFVPTNPACGAYRWHNAYTVDNKMLLQLIWSQEVIMNAEACQEAGVDLGADEICVNSHYAQHPRNLDSSGNPVVCERFVIGIIIPNYSTVPQFSCLTSILRISPFVNSLNDACYMHPTY